MTTTIQVQWHSACDACGSTVHDPAEILCRWCKGKRTTPVAFGPERARAIWDARTSDVPDILSHMSYPEIGYVFSVWARLYDGSCWQDAFFAVLNSECIGVLCEGRRKPYPMCTSDDPCLICQQKGGPAKA